MADKLDIDVLRRRVKAGLPYGARPLGPTTWEWDASRDCERPVTFEAHAWPTRMPQFQYYRGEGDMAYYVDRNPLVLVPKLTRGARGLQHGLSMTQHVPCLS